MDLCYSKQNLTPMKFQKYSTAIAIRMMKIWICTHTHTLTLENIYETMGALGCASDWSARSLFGSSFTTRRLPCTGRTSTKGFVAPSGNLDWEDYGVDHFELLTACLTSENCVAYGFSIFPPINWFSGLYTHGSGLSHAGLKAWYPTPNRALHFLHGTSSEVKLVNCVWDPRWKIVNASEG